MRTPHIILAAMALAVTTHVVAAPEADATWTSYYIAQDGTTSRCRVVSVKPTPDGVVATSYESRQSAEAALAEAAKYEIPDCGIKQ